MASRPDPEIRPAQRAWAVKEAETWCFTGRTQLVLSCAQPTAAQRARARIVNEFLDSVKAELDKSEKVLMLKRLRADRAAGQAEAEKIVTSAIADVLERSVGPFRLQLEAERSAMLAELAEANASRLDAIAGNQEAAEFLATQIRSLLQVNDIVPAAA
jgi:hypothetical protein